MDTARVSRKFQVVISLRTRRLLGIKPGQVVQVIPYENRIEMIPVKPVKEYRGFLKGVNTTVARESHRE